MNHIKCLLRRRALLSREPVHPITQDQLRDYKIHCYEDSDARR